ncbi:unnamed protein product [Zymoseptoria tritici ST99CH_1E4]|uniref:Uncharacterized protein n=1 Tax=Zymoseptoria tritici ST99CH_1E4 TaxID=1276532 RepID=A0A2H1HBV0_ZYMTR|nr:unnamed protein product [Zymoseptoria tritici ST99CH_1E4]
MSRWVNNKNLSPAIVETKKDTNQVRMADWGSVWAAYTEAWIDPSFDFVIGKTSPKAPQGTKHLPPRAPVPRVYKSAGAMVAAAANNLALTADSKRSKAIAGNFMRNFIVGGKEENFEQESAVNYNRIRRVFKRIRAEPIFISTAQAKTPTTSKIRNSAHCQKTMPTASKVHHKPIQPNPVMPVEPFELVIADERFVDWHFNHNSVSVSPLHDAVFRNATEFLGWWQKNIEAEQKAQAAPKKKGKKTAVVAAGEGECGQTGKVKGKKTPFFVKAKRVPVVKSRKVRSVSGSVMSGSTRSGR